MVTLDTSVLADLFLPVEEGRKVKAKGIIEIVEEREIEIYNPKIFIIEFLSILRRFLSKEMVETALQISRSINLLDESEIFEIARALSLEVHPRAIDAYFIATAKLSDSILISNDKTMVNNSRETGIEAYYLITEHDKVVERLREI
ncbi:MAG: type II toxin-antitoxin system VapC family toxin [archaeon]|nr:type II toxin-antitoxin system VapC family toxin [archaeon]